MAKALALAKKAKFSTHPNPKVGCVIVKDNKIVACGYHHKAGCNHAEVEAINDAKAKGIDLKDSTFYVTLEPCAHYGRTPPCALALANAKIKRCVIGILDTNEKVNSKGVKILEDANIIVDVGLLEDRAYKLNRDFFKYIKFNIPYVILKTAMSLDGKIALANRSSKWITNEGSRGYVQRIRAKADAIVCSAQTVIDDNPMLDIRENLLSKKDRAILHENPKAPLLKVILDSKGILKPENYQIFTSQRVLWVIGSDSEYGIKKYSPNIDILYLKFDNNKHIDLKELLKYLGTINIVSLLVESGGKLTSAFIDQDLFDEINCFIGPKMLGKNAISAFLCNDHNSLSNIKDLKLDKVRKFKDDVLLRYIK